ncbi:FecCD family ABC transporter permease [Glycomyces harbinensis]|uniref:Iron complex transport system permease protein n=1 Tax=Glycomyces harbinensis TaxID=58114 RepID=A0A1G6RR27_9ACTN|nr:iron ABC transporter permease [Glycomyces harbinensis]SDD06998.1 iron complex transport system permease protein [Glycomyces harbinensis]
MTAAAPPQAASQRPAPAPARIRRPAVPAILAVVLIGLLALGVLVSASNGAFAIPLGDIVASIAHKLGLGGAPVEGTGEGVLWNIRFPRVVLGLLVGACLACAGTLMQGMFGNPLAEPGIIGVSSGAAVGAVAAIAFGLTFAGNWTISLCAFIAGLATVSVVYLMSRSGGRTEVVTLVLTGVAVNGLAGALIGLFIFYADNDEITAITFWQMGSLSQATWPKILAVLPLAAVGLMTAPRYARRLDLLSLGERSARHLGVDVERLRLHLIVIVALLTGAAVAVSGVIGFIGLVVPHLLRMAAGPGHRALLPLSTMGGAAVIVWADLAARTVAAPAEIPLGILTALVGSPFFFWLLRRTRRHQGGWA